MFPRIFIIAHFFDLSRLLHKKAECGEGSDSISGQKRERAPVWGCAFSLEQMTGNFAFLQISNILCINADFRHYILNICAITGLLCHILWVRFG